MRQAAQVRAAPKGPSPVAPPARRPLGRRPMASRVAGFDSPEEGIARRPPPLRAAPLPSPPPCGSDSGDTPMAQVSICPACSVVGSLDSWCAYTYPTPPHVSHSVVPTLIQAVGRVVPAQGLPADTLSCPPVCLKLCGRCPLRSSCIVASSNVHHCTRQLLSHLAIFLQARRPQRPSPALMSTGRQQEPLLAFGTRVEGPAGASRKQAGSPEAGRGGPRPKVGHLLRLYRLSAAALMLCLAGSLHGAMDKQD